MSEKITHTAVMDDCFRLALASGKLCLALIETMRAQYLDGLSEEQAEQLLKLDQLFGRILLSIDPPDHARLRGLVAIPFTPKYIEGLRSRVQEIAVSLPK